MAGIYFRGVLTAFPGIILQLVFIPLLLEILDKTHVLTFVDKTDKKMKAAMEND